MKKTAAGSATSSGKGSTAYLILVTNEKVSHHGRNTARRNAGNDA